MIQHEKVFGLYLLRKKYFFIVKKINTSQILRNTTTTLNTNKPQ